MRYVVMVMLMTLTCFDLNAAQAATADQRESLRGLPGVGLVIEDIDAEAKADGLSVEAIRTAVELILRSSSIRILTRTEVSNTTSGAYLYVQAATYKIRSGLYAYTTTVALRQSVSLVQRPQQTIFASTWDRVYVGSPGSQNISWLINPIEDSVKIFANDFVAVNPR